MVKAAKILIFSILTMSILVGLAYSRLLSPADKMAYLDPVLQEENDAEVQVIVTAADSQQASDLVRANGGQVNADLWLIHAVSATIPASRLSALSSTPGVVSIVNNHPVTSADAPDWNNRVTDRRKIDSTYGLDGITSSQATFLPDGGFVSISDNGKGLIANQDGSERVRYNLGMGAFVFKPVVSQSGSIFLTRMEKDIFALNLDGTIRWRYTNPLKFLASAVLGPDGNLYAVDEKNHLVVLESVTGQLLLRMRFGDDSWGSPQSGLVPTQDGTLLIVSKNDPSRLYAVSPAGNLLWVFTGDRGKPFNYTPVLSNNGLVYAASSEKIVYAIDPTTGSLVYSFNPVAKISTQPVLGPNGGLYFTLDDGSLAGYGADGNQLFSFRPANMHFKTVPVVSQDGNLYAAAEEKTLFALDSATGQENWRYQLLANIHNNPVLDADQNVMIGSDGKDFVILDAHRKLVTRLMLGDRVFQPASVNEAGDILVRYGDHSLAKMSLLATNWNGGPDVEPTDIRREWSLSYPVSIDTGADQVHDAGFTGQGVTIAVIDSGVYFNKHVEDILGTNLDRQFLGQADFVGNGVCSGAGQQKPGYCFSDHRNSIDQYGHGSHVAGIIWSQISDQSTEVKMGVAPDANILSVRVLDNNGRGTYTDVIEGIQYIVANKNIYNIRVMNLSISANPLVPYFADPFDRAVEAAWANGIVVIAAAGNAGPAAQTITVPGNDPYIITVGALNGKRTAGYWADDLLASYSASGPTLDGFLKPDILAPGSNIISFMYTDKNDARCARLALTHPEFKRSISLFRMSGTSMATGVTSGVVALILQAHPELNPDQVKYRLKSSARPAGDEYGRSAYNILQQGAGRLWAPEAVFGDYQSNSFDNVGMDIQSDLSHGWETTQDLAYHYYGPVVWISSDDGQYSLFLTVQTNGNLVPLGIASKDSMSWLPISSDSPMNIRWNNGQLNWSQDTNQPAGNWTWGGGNWTWGGGNWTWGGGNWTWGGSNWTWGGGNWTWGGGNWTWGGSNWTWGGGNWTWGGGNWTWGGSAPGLLLQDLAANDVSNTIWVIDE